ncbi:alpha-tocopherol transfer protein-like [Centruroides vittatus]|uniref:alpha-tocopherol transfer protein-like n=1 Tax=Centruroides vittatus TaxID=120091 RepID=UPI00350FD467
MDGLYKMFPEEIEEFPWDERALDDFKKLINDNGIKCRMDDIFLLGFLRARKFNLEESLQLLKNYYSRRIEHSSFFKNLLPSKLEGILHLNCCKILPKPDQNGRLIGLIEIKQWNPSETLVIHLCRASFLSLELVLNLHRMQENGLIIIINTQGLTLRHMLQITPRFVNTMISLILRNSSQVRIKEIHYVNVNRIVKIFETILMPLLPVKIQKRIFFHSETTALHKFIHPKYLPIEYGGELSDLDPNEFVNIVKQNEDFFRKNEEYVKMYEESIQQRFSKGRFKYIGSDIVNRKEMLFENSKKQDLENSLVEVKSMNK